MIFDSVPDTLSQLIRTALVAKPGCTFLVSDYSAIEARVIAYLAGETWRMEVFKNGGDIYCASASQMFHVPVEKHGVNAHLRAIFSKLGASSRTEAVAIALRKHLLKI